METHYEVTFDKSRFNIQQIHEFLSKSYWAENIPIEVVKNSIENSFCIGILLGNTQIAFARMITDKATFAYLADVFVIPEHRGKGLSKLLMKELLSRPEFKGLRRILLATRDAHGLYTQFGFSKLSSPDSFMEIRNVDVYKKQ